MKLYLITETEIYDGESESNTYLSESDPKNYSRNNYKLTSVEATVNDVTLAMMIQAIESELEGGNYHDEIFFPGWLSGILSKHLPEDKVKEIFWDMIQDKGLLWRD
jgi:hypothetical protein